MNVDVEADIAAYARRQRLEREKRWRDHNPDKVRQIRANRRAKYKTPVPITWEPPPEPTRPRTVDWRTALDQRISRCPTCDEWCFDQQCEHCLIQIARTNRRNTAA
jgi:hypothetical protein